jgi:AcrR family transcriptional regulator
VKAPFEKNIHDVLTQTKLHKDTFAVPELMAILESALECSLATDVPPEEVILGFVNDATKALTASPIYSDTLMRELYRNVLKVAAVYNLPREDLLEDLLFLSLKRLPERQEKRRKKHKDGRTRILQAALAEFSERGYHASTIDSIADRAGIAKGTVYRYFKTKEALFLALKEDTMTEFVELARKDLSGEDDILVIIERVIRMYLSFFERNSAFFKVIIQEHKEFGTEFSEKFINELILALPGLKRRCWKASRSGRLKQMNYFTVFYGIIGFLNGVIQKWLHDGGEGPLVAETDTVIEVLFYGFVVQPSSADRVNPLKVIS